eukprot:TRINITY_DN11080_c1_g1_i1.p1 TRINITY_DN11080_c1_g1~~TRINITY_DN11080_c1_g1_i1.p1  ORF type:complete len:223 (-),score=30.18 TRINITY_DN11080_c1_g1_i1:440-1108(-)
MTHQDSEKGQASTDSDATHDGKGSCAICFQALMPSRTSVTKCGHRFCYRCLDIWRDNSENGDCPSCRCKLSEAYAFAEACNLAAEGDKDAEAIAKFQETLRLCTEAPWAAPHFNLGILLNRKGDAIAAEANFRRAAELRRDDPDAALFWGRALLAIGRKGEAQAALQRVRRLRPDSREAASLLASLGYNSRSSAQSSGASAITTTQLAELRSRRIQRSLGLS